MKNRLSSAEQEYLKQVQITNAHQKELLGVQRPQTVNGLKDLVFECDSALKLQLQKFGTYSYSDYLSPVTNSVNVDVATLNEKLLLNNALCISPIKGPDSSQSTYFFFLQVVISPLGY